MNQESLVSVESISKKYCKNLKRSLWYGVKDISSELLGINSNNTLRNGEFWAINDLSFELKRGQCLGLIGPNGAGKSTLLKMLNGLIKPDSGQISIRGKVGALIELNAGLNPILTGRENIYVLGQIRGFTKYEIDQKIEEIIDFSEISEFIDSPVQNYSSGMRVRLGFSVAAQMEPDVLLIDEVLAVGDMAFAIKSLRKIDEILDKSAVIFVSHSMPHVSRISNKLLLMKKGTVEYYGENISHGIDLYYSKQGSIVTSYFKGDDVELLRAWFPDNTANEDLYSLNHLDDLSIAFRIRVLNRYKSPFLSVVFYDKEQRPVGVVMNTSPLGKSNIEFQDADSTTFISEVNIPGFNLSKGVYSITLAVTEEFGKHFLMRAQNIAVFQVKSNITVWEPVEFDSKWS